MAKTRKAYEAPEIGACSARMMKALTKRAAGGDTEALEQLLGLEAVLASAIADAGRGLREFGYSLHDLSVVTGTSRQACSKRFSLAEEGRHLASQREDLIAQGVDPAALLVPLLPQD